MLFEIYAILYINNNVAWYQIVRKILFTFDNMDNNRMIFGIGWSTCIYTSIGHTDVKNFQCRHQYILSTSSPLKFSSSSFKWTLVPTVSRVIGIVYLCNGDGWFLFHNTRMIDHFVSWYVFVEDIILYLRYWKFS